MPPNIISPPDPVSTDRGDQEIERQPPSEDTRPEPQAVEPEFNHRPDYGEYPAMIEARVNGYSWEEIHSFSSQKRGEATDAGYSHEEIDAFLGYDNSGAYRNAARAGAKRDFAQMAADEKSEIKQGAPTPEEALRAKLDRIFNLHLENNADPSPSFRRLLQQGTVTKINSELPQSFKEYPSDRDVGAKGGLMTGASRTDQSDADADPTMNTLLPQGHGSTDTFMELNPAEHDQQGPGVPGEREI